MKRAKKRARKEIRPPAQLRNGFYNPVLTPTHFDWGCNKSIQPDPFVDANSFRETAECRRCLPPFYRTIDILRAPGSLQIHASLSPREAKYLKASDTLSEREQPISPCDLTPYNGTRDLPEHY